MDLMDLHHFQLEISDSNISSQDNDYLTYNQLISYRRRGLRNGNWPLLKTVEKGLFQCALWLARERDRISNIELMIQIFGIVSKLLNNLKNRIENAGRRRARMIFKASANPRGVFGWAPRLREWLYDSRYVWYLGVMDVND